VREFEFHQRIYVCILTALAGALFGIWTAPVPATAHSGGTDAYGCHNETATGTYHCHSGAPLACQGRTFSSQSAMLASGCRTATTTTYSLVVTKVGNGSVSSSPSGILCGSTCTASFNSGTIVVLTATAASGYTFAGWSGACTGTGSCSLSMTVARSITATFNAVTPTAYTLTVAKAGTGSGIVTSSVGGISCGNTCAATYNEGASVTLSAAPTIGSTFGGWSGACSGTGTCSLTMTAARSVTATFNAVAPTTYTLSVGRAGTGSGTVTSSIGDINCGSSCSANYNPGASVTLSATASTGSTFSGWSGDCSGVPCIVAMDGPHNVTATFNLITTGGSGSGGGAGAGSSGTLPKATMGGAPVIFPHFAQGGGYQTTFTFNNLSDTPTTVTLNLYGQDGTLIGTTPLGLMGRGSSSFGMSGGNLVIGWAHAVSNPPVDLAGTETIQLFNGSGVLVMEASVLPPQPDILLRVPVYEKAGFGTGVAFVNLGPVPSTATMTLRGPNGAVVSTGSVSLNAAQQTAKFISELFSITDFEGTLELSAPESIAAVAIRQNFASGIFSTVPVSPMPTEVFFSPNAGASSKIVQEINQTQRTIDIAIYSFTRDEIADALMAAKDRGVRVRILADSSQANGTGSDIARLEAAGFQLKRTNGGSGGILHHKYAIFDGRLLVTGSYNWSTNAEENNDENALFIRDRSVIEAFKKNFDAMWSTR
jgi:hypothetical protein